MASGSDGRPFCLQSPNFTIPSRKVRAEWVPEDLAWRTVHTRAAERSRCHRGTQGVRFPSPAARSCQGVANPAKPNTVSKNASGAQPSSWQLVSPALLLPGCLGPGVHVQALGLRLHSQWRRSCWTLRKKLHESY